MIYFLSLLAIILAFFVGGLKALFLVIILGILEVSLSFDNAVVNASILKNMSQKWQKRFLTWGILIAVFGMRLIFPIAIVSFAGNINFLEVINIAINFPDEYKNNLVAAHNKIASFGGIFLLMVFLKFIFNIEKQVFWIFGEKYLSKINFWIGSFLTLIVVFAFLPLSIISAILGIVTFVLIKKIADYFGKNSRSIEAIGFASFMYLEVLDASFSLDGVIGAFAISNDIFIIMLGLGIGAMFIRTLTIKLVQNKTLQNYIYLESGAFFGIGSLAIIMLLSTKFHVSEIVTGLIGATFIIISIIHSKCKKL